MRLLTFIPLSLSHHFNHLLIVSFWQSQEKRTGKNWKPNKCKLPIIMEKVCLAANFKSNWDGKSFIHSMFSFKFIQHFIIGMQGFLSRKLQNKWNIQMRNAWNIAFDILIITHFVYFIDLSNTLGYHIQVKTWNFAKFK